MTSRSSAAAPILAVLAFVGGMLKINPKQLRTKRKAAPKTRAKEQN